MVSKWAVAVVVGVLHMSEAERSRLRAGSSRPAFHCVLPEFGPENLRLVADVCELNYQFEVCIDGTYF